MHCSAAFVQDLPRFLRGQAAKESQLYYLPLGRCKRVKRPGDSGKFNAGLRRCPWIQWGFHWHCINGDSLSFCRFPKIVDDQVMGDLNKPGLHWDAALFI
jgi:hypothetical protein